MGMVVESIGPVEPVSNQKRINRIEKPLEGGQADSIDVSAEAKSAADNFHKVELVKNSPDVRNEKIAEVKEKLQDPNYINEKVIDELADQIMQSFGI